MSIDQKRCSGITFLDSRNVATSAVISGGSMRTTSSAKSPSASSFVPTATRSVRSGAVVGESGPSKSPKRGTRVIIRICSMCGQAKLPSQFHSSRTGQFSYCGDCRRAYDRRHYAERGRAARLARARVHRNSARVWMVSLKGDHPCTDCREVFPPWVMHWDHLPGHRKVGEISSMVGRRPREAVLDELAKCELVCSNCHAVRTRERALGRSNGGNRA